MREINWREFFEQPTMRVQEGRALVRFLPDWIKSWEDWITLSILSLLYLGTARAIEIAGWVRDMPSLVIVAFLALFVGTTAARSAQGGFRLQLTTFAIGVIVVMWQILTIMSADLPWTGLREFYNRMSEWVIVVKDGGISRDPLPFILLVTGLTWIGTYIAAWGVFHWRSPWLALIPAGSAIFSNIAYQPEQFHFSLVIFAFGALLLIMRLYLMDKLAEWDRLGVQRPEFISLSFVNYTSWVAFLVLGVSLMIPTAVRSSVVNDFWEKVTAPFEPLTDDFQRTFAALRTRKVQPIHSFGAVQPFKSSIKLREMPVADVRVSASGGFLRGAAYDVYTSDGWLMGNHSDVSVGEIPAGDIVRQILEENSDGLEREVVQAEITVLAYRPVLLSPGLPISADVPAVAVLSEESVYRLDLSGRGRGGRVSQFGLPGDVRDFLAAITGGGSFLSDQQIREYLEATDLAVVGVQRQAATGEVERVDLARVSPLPDLLAVVNTSNLQPGQTYRVTAAVTRASASRLEEASTAYPDWVVEHYLQLPDSLPHRVTELAREITRNAPTPLQKAMAIQQYLRQYPIEIEMPDIPIGRDGVDFFLFDAKKGYFDFHASAMVVMLRSVGVPSRLAVGFVLDSSDYDEATGTYRVRERHSYAWPEVYFPGVGWVEFNPTPDRPLLGLLPDNTPSTAISSQEELDLLAIPLGTEFDITPTESAEQSVEAASTGRSYWVFVWLGAAVAALGALAMLGRFVWEWGLADLPYPAQIWEKTLRLARFAKLRPEPQQTPREYARFLSRELPEVEGIDQLADSYGRAQFGKKTSDESDIERVRQVWTQVRNKLLARILRWR